MSSSKTGTPWWKRAVVYQIYPRSFRDSNGDGVGDLGGICEKLDYLAWLGIDALWISPVFPSPMADFGYDVSDYCGVDPLFGSLADLDRLIAQAHARSIRVLLDWVPNHTSDQHPWFRESRSSRTSAKRDWYLWRDPAPGGGPPNNWTSTFTRGAPAWTLDPATGQYYLHLFLPAQPDLNWANPEVEAAMSSVLRFWLDRGVDGFRVDVVHCIGKDPALPDNPTELASIPHCVLNEHESTHAILRRLRRLVDGYPGDRVLVGEVFLLFGATSTYYGSGDELHLAFDLPAAVRTPWSCDDWHTRVTSYLASLEPAGSWPTWVLSNHDTPRHRTRFGSEARARAAAVLLLTLPGTPFLYAGEELALEDATIPPERVVDPGGRDGCRAPLPWDEGPEHGWGDRAWLPFAPEPATRAVSAQQSDPSSVLGLYRRLLALRRSSPGLHSGVFHALPAPPGVLAFQRVLEREQWTVLVNFESRAVEHIDVAGTVAVSSDGPGEGKPFLGALESDQAVVLRTPS